MALKRSKDPETDKRVRHKRKLSGSIESESSAPKKSAKTTSPTKKKKATLVRDTTLKQTLTGKTGYGRLHVSLALQNTHEKGLSF